MIRRAKHENLLCAYIASLQWSSKHSDLTIQCSDGQMITSHCSILSSTSPFLKTVLLESDEPHLILPDVCLDDMKALLSLLHSGTVNVNNLYVASNKPLLNLLIRFDFLWNT